MSPIEGGSIRTRYRFFPALVAGAYAVTSLLWILFSDRIVADLFTDGQTYHQVQTYKGLFFISASSLLIFLLLRWTWKDILTAYRTARESERRLQLALAGADGGVWAIDLANGACCAIWRRGVLRRRDALVCGSGELFAGVCGRDRSFWPIADAAMA